MTKKDYKEYADFVKEIGYGKIDEIDVTHDGFPLSPKESIFIDTFLLGGELNKSLKTANLRLRDIAGKDYIMDEIKYRLDLLKKATIADSDEILQYFTKVMRGEEKDQFGLDAPLSERTAAAKELAKRIIDYAQMIAQAEAQNPEVKITLNFEGLD